MSSDENVVADNWEDGGAEAVEAMGKRFEQVKILDRKKQELEKLKSDVQVENVESIVIKTVDGDSVAEGPGPSQDEPKRVLLRRPMDGSHHVETKPRGSHGRGRQTHSAQKGPPKTLEQKQAQYQAARERIMGTEYNPDKNEIRELTVVERSKSPETVTINKSNSAQQMKELGIDFTAEEESRPQTTMIQPHLYMQQDYSIPPPQLHHAPPSQSQNEVASLGISSHHIAPQFVAQNRNETRLFTILPNMSAHTSLPSGPQFNAYAHQNNMEGFTGGSTQTVYDDRGMQFYTYPQQQMLQNCQQNYVQNMPFNMFSIPPPSHPPSLMSLPTNPPSSIPMMYSQVASSNFNQRNGPKNIQKSRGGKKPNVNMQSQLNMRPPMPIPPRINSNQNPVPFGCPPMDVNLYYNGQRQIPPNAGVGILGPAPYSNIQPMMPRDGHANNISGGGHHSQQ